MLATINVKINDEWSEIPAIKGKDGVGIPTGGTTGQVLAKVSNSDYDTEWVTQTGGTTGNIPTKVSELENDSGFISSIPNEYITDSELNAKGYLTEHQDISHLATKDEIPSIDGLASETYVTNYAQPKGNYLTSIPSEYITETELNNKGYLTNETDPTVPNHVKNITSADITNWNNKSEFSGSYNDLTNKPTIPTIPSNVSAFTNDTGYITEIPSDYITETELNDKGYLTSIPDDYVLKTGGTMQGSLHATYTETGGQLRNIYTSTSEPSSSDGIDGDIWIVYEV